MRYCPIVSEVGYNASEVDIYLVVTRAEMSVNSTRHVKFMTIIAQFAG